MEVLNDRYTKEEMKGTTTAGADDSEPVSQARLLRSLPWADVSGTSTSFPGTSPQLRVELGHFFLLGAVSSS